MVCDESYLRKSDAVLDWCVHVESDNPASMHECFELKVAFGEADEGSLKSWLLVQNTIKHLAKKYEKFRRRNLLLFSQ